MLLFVCAVCLSGLVLWTVHTLVGQPDIQSLFNLHVWGMALFASLATVATSLIASQKKAKVWTTLHAIGMALAVGSMLMAFGAIWVNKDIKGRSHITTWHSYFGVAAISTALSTSFGGVMAYFRIGGSFFAHLGLGVG